MNTNLTCAQVASLINFYIEGKLNSTLGKFVDIHIQNCPRCKRKFNELQKILFKYLQLKNKQKSQSEDNDAELVSNLSAYIDNELNTNENIKIKKMTISNPSTRKKLEDMYKFQKLMQLAYEKTKNDNKFDYSKNIISILNENSDYNTTFFSKIIFLFVVIVISIIIGFVYLNF